MKKIHIIAVLVLVLIAVAVADVLDRVVAVVDTEIILLSELESQLQILAVQGVIDFKDPAQKDSLMEELEVLEKFMIDSGNKKALEVYFPHTLYEVSSVLEKAI